jgi:hypothetical protein
VSLSIIYCRFNRFLRRARARAGLKSVAGGLSERMKQIRAECPSNFLRTTLFFVEKGEKEKHGRRIPLFSLALSLWLCAAQLRILDLSRRNLLLREFMCVAAAEPSSLASVGAISCCLRCRARTPKYGGGIKRIFIYEMKPQTEIAAGIKGN